MFYSMEPISKSDAVFVLKRFISEELVNQDWYKKIKPYVKAMVLYGSVAKEKNRIDSDIDFLIFIPLHIEEKYTKGEYFFNFEGHEINTVLRSIERLRTIAEKNNDEFEKEVFRGSEILFEQDNEVRLLINNIENKQ